MTNAAVSPSAARGLWRWSGLVLGLIGNLIPLLGVLLWDWDTFQLLMLYWMETVIVAFWTLRRLARLPAGQAGDITINGKTRPATNRMLVGFFSLHAGLFILVHLIFLLALFSGDWLKNVHGPASFFSELLLKNGIWVALLFFFIAAWIAFLVDSQTRFARNVEQRLQSSRVVARATEKTDAVGGVVGALYVRIVIMQVAIIFGAWFANSIGSLAPLLLVITLKTLVDLALGCGIPTIKGAAYSSGSTSVGS